MKNVKYILLVVIFTSITIIFQSCTEYSTYLNIPISTTVVVKNPTKIPENRTACLETNETYRSLKDQLDPNKDVVAAAIWTKYDSVGTKGIFYVRILDQNNNVLLERILDDGNNGLIPISNYKIFPYLIILLPQERTAVNAALRAGLCIKCAFFMGLVDTPTWNFAIDFKFVIGVKLKVNS